MGGTIYEDISTYEQWSIYSAQIPLKTQHEQSIHTCMHSVSNTEDTGWYKHLNTIFWTSLAPFLVCSINTLHEILYILPTRQHPFLARIILKINCTKIMQSLLRHQNISTYKPLPYTAAVQIGQSYSFIPPLCLQERYREIFTYITRYSPSPQLSVYALNGCQVKKQQLADLFRTVKPVMVA